MRRFFGRFFSSAPGWVALVLFLGSVSAAAVPVFNGSISIPSGGYINNPVGLATSVPGSPSTNLLEQWPGNAEIDYNPSNVQGGGKQTIVFRNHPVNSAQGSPAFLFVDESPEGCISTGSATNDYAAAFWTSDNHVVWDMTCPFSNKYVFYDSSFGMDFTTTVDASTVIPFTYFSGPASNCTTAATYILSQWQATDGTRVAWMQCNGSIHTNSDVVAGGNVSATGNVSGVNITASGTVSGATVSSSGNVTATGKVTATAHNFCSSSSGIPCEYFGNCSLTAQVQCSVTNPVPSGSVCTASYDATTSVAVANLVPAEPQVSGTTLTIYGTASSAQTGTLKFNATCL